MSPAQIRDRVKVSYPHLYSTPAHLAGIARGNYQNEDHALLNPIYSLVMRSSDFVLDRRGRPMMAEDAVAFIEGVVSIHGKVQEAGSDRQSI
jgi:hypothetical protein